MKPQTNSIKERFQAELKDKFNEKKFDQDVKAGTPITLDDLEKYKFEEEKIELPKSEDKDKDEPNPNETNMKDNSGLVFKGSFKDGVYSAVGSNGVVIKSKNIDDFHRKLAKYIKLRAMKNGKKPLASLRVGKNIKNKEEIMESFARNFINEGVAVMGDLPKSPEFWNNLKNEYLAKKGSNIQMWNKLTQFVPKEYMQSKQAETQKQSNPKSSEHQPKKESQKPAGPAHALAMSQARSGR
jgi:hypothetical protein